MEEGGFFSPALFSLYHIIAVVCLHTNCPDIMTNVLLMFVGIYCLFFFFWNHPITGFKTGINSIILFLYVYEYVCKGTFSQRKKS